MTATPSVERFAELRAQLDTYYRETNITELGKLVNEIETRISGSYLKQKYEKNPFAKAYLILTFEDRHRSERKKMPDLLYQALSSLEKNKGYKLTAEYAPGAFLWHVYIRREFLQ